MRSPVLLILAVCVMAAGCGGDARRSSDDGEDATGCEPGPAVVNGVAVFRHCGPAGASVEFESRRGVTVGGAGGGRCTIAAGSLSIDLGETVVDPDPPGGDLRVLVGNSLHILLGRPGGVVASVARTPSAADVAASWRVAGHRGSLERKGRRLTVGAGLRTGTISGTSTEGERVRISWDCGEDLLPRLP